LGGGGGIYECKLDGAAETGCCCFVFFGIAVVGEAGERDVGFGFIGGGSHFCVRLDGL